MHTVSKEYARAHLEELIAEVVHGGEVAVDMGDDVLVRWTVERKTPAAEAKAGSWPVLGMLKGKVWMAPDFDEIPEGFDGRTVETKTGWPLMGLYAGKIILPEGWDADLPSEMWDALKIGGMPTA